MELYVDLDRELAARYGVPPGSLEVWPETPCLRVASLRGPGQGLGELTRALTVA